MDSSNVPEQPSKRLLWVGIGAVILLVAVIVGISFMMASTSKKDEAKSISPTPPQVATKQEITENLSTLNESVKQAAKDQTAAKEAVKASTAQTKVGN